MHRITLDGNHGNGRYRGDCDCGFVWNGIAEHLADGPYNPAYPCAEAVIHNRMAHNGEAPFLRFTTRFELWLSTYFEQVVARANELPRR